MDTTVPTSRLANVLNPNGTRTVFDYLPNSGDKRLAQIRHEVAATSDLIAQHDYTYAATGRIDTWTQGRVGVPPAEESSLLSFGYDRIDQLTTVAQTGPAPRQLAYRYDRAGNRVSVVPRVVH